MESLHARYPFLAAAREAVSEADVDLATLVADDGPVVGRALDRVRLAIEEGRVGDPASDRVELLSYPVARVLVSLVDEPGLPDRYARAEADTARERFVADIEDEDDLRSVTRDRLTLDALLAEFDLDDRVTVTSDAAAGTGRRAGTTAATARGASVGVAVGAYLRLTDGLPDPRWRLATRSLADGEVAVVREELYDLLREAVRERIAADLPLSVPEPIADELDDAVADLRGQLDDLDHDWEIDAVDPDLFPPCVEALLERVEAGDPLPDHSQFTLVAFLATAGMESGEIVSRLAVHDDIDADRLETRVARLREDGEDAVYPPPSCETMVAYGDCVNTDDLCERVAHPLGYYERRLAGERPG